MIEVFTGERRPHRTQAPSYNDNYMTDNGNYMTETKFNILVLELRLKIANLDLVNLSRILTVRW